MSTKLDELKSLRIEDSHRTGASEPKWSKRWILTGIGILVLLGIAATVYRITASTAPEVEVTRAVAESSSAPGVILNASGYIVAHHKINVNSKVTGRVAWVGVEKGDKVKEGQVVVRLEDQEFRAQYEQARGNLEYAKARLAELEAGSRPQEIERARHDLEQAKATLIDDKANLDRTRPLVAEGVMSRQALDDALARYEASAQRVNSLQRTYDLAKIGPRIEQIDQARAQVIQARGQLDYAQSQLDATQIRAPVTGTILERTAEKGELITAQFASTAEGGPQGSVVALADLNDLQVELDIAQQDFAKLGPKQKGIVTTDAFPDRKYDGVIAEISPEANRQKATVQVKVQVLNPDGFLRPDMNANVQFLSEEKPGEVTTGSVVPTNALRDRSGKKVVFVAYNGKAVVREVKVLGQRSNGYLVDGLTGGELLLSNPPADLKDGDRIRIKSSK
ncbi:MAG TPA: efflux RND transporter periplasmic adaptor subunit [Terriglobales bacterium]|nr:efflux RND transporter periplasmic adaptor subunit [Terriglobales bacterium]